MGMFLGAVMGGSVDLKVSEGWHKQKLAAVALPRNSRENGGSYHFRTIRYKCLRKGRSHIHCK